MGRPLGSVNVLPSADLASLSATLRLPPPQHPDPVLPPAPAGTPADLVPIKVALKWAGITKRCLRRWMQQGKVQRYGRLGAYRVSMAEVMPPCPYPGPYTSVSPQMRVVDTLKVV
jgi:hypothetical protein